MSGQNQKNFSVCRRMNLIYDAQLYRVLSKCRRLFKRCYNISRHEMALHTHENDNRI